MSQPTSYQLLKDIYIATTNLEAKFDKRMTMLEEKQNKTESKINTLAGKAAIGVIVLSAVIGTAVGLIVEWIKRLIGKGM